MNGTKERMSKRMSNGTAFSRRPVGRPAYGVEPAADGWVRRVSVGRVLMCPPVYFDVRYEINPWMSVKRRVNRELAELQWERLHDVLRNDLRLDVELVAPAALPDFVFTANAGICVGKTFVASNFRYRERAEEEPHWEAWFEAAGFDVVRPPAALAFEGEGDLLVVGAKAVGGYGLRTDCAALEWVGRTLGLRVTPLELVDPWFYHLDTCLCPLTESSALYYPGAFSRDARDTIRRAFPDAIAVGESEAKRFVCNAVVAGGRVVMSAGCPEARLALQARGFEVYEVDVSEFLKAGGGAKCLALHLGTYPLAPSRRGKGEKLPLIPSLSKEGRNAVRWETPASTVPLHKGDHRGSLMQTWPERERRALLQTGHRRLGVTLVRGNGSRVWDDEGREYLDFIAGWATLSLGHCHPVVVGALREQSERLLVGSNDVYTRPAIELAELLLAPSPFDKAYFQNSGSEAVELAIKLARKFGKARLDGAWQVICAEDGFHGRTLGALSATGHEAYRTPFEPLVPGFVHVPFNDLGAIRQATTPETCAVLLEPIQGEGGVYVADLDYLRGVREWCDEQGLVLILDEVQTGMCRTGKLFAFEHYGIEPDVVALGKGLGGGVPVSAVLMKEGMALLERGEHGTTFGGNALLCHVAHAAVRWMLETDLCRHVRRVGGELSTRLERMAAAGHGITEVRGKGLLVAVEFDGDVAMEVAHACTKEGLLVNPVRPNAIRLMPPLTVTSAEVFEAMAIFERVLEHVGLRSR